MKQTIIDFIRAYVQEYQSRDTIATSYGEPLVGFADAHHPYIQSLPQLISPTHELPQNVLPEARIIIAYFVPFTRDIAKSNRTTGILASPEWARAYEETNALFGELNEALIRLIHEKAGLAGITPKATTFDQQRLISDWSHRHIAYAAGLGTFGINNMLLTKHGCCGRFSTVVTNLDLAPDAPADAEYCLYKKNGSCGVCVKNCPTGALTAEGYDRHKCYALCRENAKIYTQFGSSYTNEDGTGANSEGSEVCGKCVTSSPCAFWRLK
ncbi:MAG: epoxyqueuosine reductase [Firmicutes bacterium]|nr:epoxyqueuosine reductase [Bacillota bacterium]